MLTAIFVVRLLSVSLVTSYAVGVQLDQLEGHSIKVTEPQKMEETKADQMWTPEVSVHLLSLVETINTKLATWDVRFGQLETQMSTLNSHVDAVESRITSKINDGESQLAAVEQRLENQVMRIAGDMASVKDKLTETKEEMKREVASLESKQVTVTANSEDKLRLEIGLLKQILTVKPSESCASDVSMIGIGRELHNFGNYVSDGVDDRLKKLTESFDVRKEELLDHFRNVTDTLGQSINEAAKTLYVVSGDISVNMNESLKILRDAILEDTGKLVTEIKNVTVPVYEKIGNVTNEMMVVKEGVKSAVEKVKDLPGTVTERMDLNLSNFSREMSQKLDDELGILNSSLMTSFENLQLELDEEMKNLGKPDFKSCWKGMLERATHSPYPYPVFYANIGTDNEMEFLCDTTTTGGGWVIIQYRSRGDTDFYRGWEDYKKGFGSLDKDFWIGLDTIHRLTSSATYELRIELKYNGQSKFAHYATFSVGSEEENYKLSVGSYDGTAGNELTGSESLNGMEFSTKDRDNDESSDHCAVRWTGAWWYNACHYSNLNGKWGNDGGGGPMWHDFTGTETASFTEMKIRRVDN